jgi:hypothetical protein
VLAAPSTWLNLDGNERYAAPPGSYDWANSGPAGAACSNGGVNVAGSGGLFNCGVPGAGSAPPTAPQLTPAAAADASIISAVFIADPISSDTNPGCTGGDPTTFPGGHKNGDDLSTPGSLPYVAGSNPPKTDIGDVFAVSHSTPTRPEMFFGSERLVNNGDSHVDFEFLQSVLTRTATTSCSGQINGHRTEGDLLIAADFTNGGSLAGFSVDQWHCNAEPGPQPADGTVCDPLGNSPVPHYEDVTAAAAAAITFLVNAADIPCGGWICRDQSTGNSTTVAANDLLEGGVNLGQLPFNGCFHTFLPHTRTAQQFTATLADFTGPVPFDTCRPPAIASTSSPTGSTAPGAVAHDTVSVTSPGAGPTPTGTVTFFLCSFPQATGAGCAGGAQVGSGKALVAGSATSDPAPAATATGTYCWNAVYTPDTASLGIYDTASHTNATSECFSLATPKFPNTGLEAGWAADQALKLTLVALLVGVAALAGLRRRRA